MPQRWAFNSKSFAWGMPEGLTQYTSVGPTVIQESEVDAEFKSTVYAKSLSSIGQNNTVWSMYRGKYTSAFGDLTQLSGTQSWSCAWHDDQQVYEKYHDAHSIHGTINQGMSGVNAVIDPYVFDRIDGSANSSGATPFRTNDLTGIHALSYPTCFTEDQRVGDNRYIQRWGLRTCNPDVYWKSNSTLFGNYVTIGVTTINRQCYWYVDVSIKPRYSLVTNAKLTERIYYGYSLPDPSDPSANSYYTLWANPFIKWFYYSPAFGSQSGTYPGRYGVAFPAGSIEPSPSWSIPADRVYANYTNFLYGFNPPPDVANSWINRPGPLAPHPASTLSSSPPGGWMSSIRLIYRSVAPIRCVSDIEQSNIVDLVLTTGDFRTPADQNNPTWAAFLVNMNSAWGLTGIPHTATIQRMEDFS